MVAWGEGRSGARERVGGGEDRVAAVEAGSVEG